MSKEFEKLVEAYGDAVLNADWTASAHPTFGRLKAANDAVEAAKAALLAHVNELREELAEARREKLHDEVKHEELREENERLKALAGVFCEVHTEGIVECPCCLVVHLSDKVAERETLCHQLEQENAALRDRIEKLEGSIKAYLKDPLWNPAPLKATLES